MTARRKSGAGVALAAITVAALMSCDFQRRSAGYACDSQDDCSGGRVCSGGWCVEGDGGQSIADADPNAPDTGPDALVTCPAGCSRCDLDTCVVECLTNDSCAEPVVCPPGIPCRVECTGKNTCNGGIDCGDSTDCLVNCIGNDSCQGLITCGTLPCRVNCLETATCAMGIDCDESCKCDTVCSGDGACAVPPTCPSAQCTDSGTGECDSSPGPCHECPL